MDAQDSCVAQTAFQHPGIDGLDLASRKVLDAYFADGRDDVPVDVALVAYLRPDGPSDSSSATQNLAWSFGI